MMKKIVMFFLAFCIICSTCHSKEPILDEETVELCNQMILNIYYKILEVRDRYKELSDFDETAFFQNKRGIYVIMYESKSVDKRRRGKEPYAFGVTIDTMDDETFKNKQGAFNFGFPPLGLKISGYQIKHLLRSQYNILPLVEEQGALLADHQQKYLPLRISIRPLKEQFYVKEDIEFEVILTNVSKRHMTVQPLNDKTLFFLFENEFWGTSPSLKGAQYRSQAMPVILKSGESLSKVYKGESFVRPKEIEIYGVYRMKIDGVNPTTKLKIKIVDEEE